MTGRRLAAAKRRDPLCFALATNAGAMRAVLRLAMVEIQRTHVKRAKARGLVDPRIAALSFIHRLGGSLNQPST